MHTMVVTVWVVWSIVVTFCSCEGVHYGVIKGAEQDNSNDEALEQWSNLEGTMEADELEDLKVQLQWLRLRKNIQEVLWYHSGGVAGDDNYVEKDPSDTKDQPEPKKPADQPSEPEEPSNQPSEPQEPSNQPSEPQEPSNQPSEPEEPSNQPSEPQEPSNQPMEQPDRSCPGKKRPKKIKPKYKKNKDINGHKKCKKPHKITIKHPRKKPIHHDHQGGSRRNGDRRGGDRHRGDGGNRGGQIDGGHRIGGGQIGGGRRISYHSDGRRRYG